MGDVLENVQAIFDELDKSYLTTDDRGPQASFSLIPVKDLMQNPKPLPWLIKGFIPAGSIGQIFGDPEAGKSLLSLWIATCVATNNDWDGETIKNQGDVIYLAGEGKYGLPQRMMALSIHHNLDPIGMHFSELPAALNVETEAAAVSGSIDALNLEKVSLIVIDTLHRHMNGDENSSKDFGELLRTLDGYRLKYDCTILIIHHSGHSEKKRSRGTSSIRGAWDFEYCLTLNDDIVEMTCEKSKDFQKPKSRFYAIEVVDLPWADEDGNAIKSVTLSPTEGSRAPRVKLTSQERRTLSMMKDVMKLTKTLPPPEVFDAPETDLKGGQIACPLRDLRAHVRKVGGISDSDNGGTQKRALHRSLQSLRDKEFIGIYEDWAWLRDKGDIEGQT